MESGSTTSHVPDVTRREFPEQRELAAATPFRRIVACLDGSSTSDAIVDHGRAVAAALGAPLTVLRVLEPPGDGQTPPDPLVWDVRAREVRAHLDQIVAQVVAAFEPSEVDVTSTLMEGRAAEVICDWAAAHQGDLLVLGTHGEHERRAWALSGTAHKLIEGAPGSLLLVPIVRRMSAETLRYRRILLPLDGSRRAEAVLPLVQRLAITHGSTVIVSHVIPDVELTGPGPLTADDLALERAVTSRNERVARSYLKQVRARLEDAGVEVRLSLGRGDAGERLASAADREEIDLVAMSAYGRHGPRGTAPYGGVAAHLVTHLGVPILMLREGVSPRRQQNGFEKGRLPSMVT